MASMKDVTLGDDELDAAKMKPSWEVAVTYCNQLLFASSFVALVLIDFREEIDAKCVYVNLNETKGASTLRQEFIDAYCYNQLFILARYPGAGGLMGTVAAYAICMWWTYPSSMRNAFRALANADEQLNDNRITQTDLSTHDLETLSEDKIHAINFASEYMNKYIEFHGKKLVTIYVVAMILRLGCFILAIWKITTTFLLNRDEAYKSYFECDVNLHNGTTNLQFFCTSDIKLCGFVFGLCVFVIATFMLCSSAYGVAVAVIICNPPGLRYVCCCLSLKRENGDTHQGDNLEFLQRFCVDSTTVCPALKKLLSYAIANGGCFLVPKKKKDSDSG